MRDLPSGPCDQNFDQEGHTRQAVQGHLDRGVRYLYRPCLRVGLPDNGSVQNYHLCQPCRVFQQECRDLCQQRHNGRVLHDVALLQQQRSEENEESDHFYRLRHLGEHRLVQQLDLAQHLQHCGFDDGDSGILPVHHSSADSSSQHSYGFYHSALCYSAVRARQLVYGRRSRVQLYRVVLSRSAVWLCIAARGSWRLYLLAWCSGLFARGSHHLTLRSGIFARGSYLLALRYLHGVFLPRSAVCSWISACGP
jgi:hypothetical protein